MPETSPTADTRPSIKELVDEYDRLGNQEARAEYVEAMDRFFDTGSMASVPQPPQMSGATMPNTTDEDDDGRNVQEMMSLLAEVEQTRVSLKRVDKLIKGFGHIADVKRKRLDGLTTTLKEVPESTIKLLCTEAQESIKSHREHLTSWAEQWTRHAELLRQMASRPDNTT